MNFTVVTQATFINQSIIRFLCFKEVGKNLKLNNQIKSIKKTEKNNQKIGVKIEKSTKKFIKN